MTCNTFYQFQSVQAIVFVQTIDRCETVVFFSQRKLAGIYQPLSSAGEWWQNGAFDQICLQRRAVLTSCQANDVKGTSLNYDKICRLRDYPISMLRQRLN